MFWGCGMDRDNTTIVIDGYNYIGTINELRPDRLRQLREGLVGMLKRYYRLRGIKTVVVFDSRDRVQVWNKAVVPGVRVIFTPAGMIADDWIVSNLRRFRGIVGVVTNDRELRRRIEKQGGIWVGCEEFRDAVEAFHRARTFVEESGGDGEDSVQEGRPRVEERDSGVWAMYVDAAGVKPLWDRGLPKERREVDEDAARMIEAFTRVTDRVKQEKQAGLQGGEKKQALSRKELFRRRQVAFLALLRGM